MLFCHSCEKLRNLPSLNLFKITLKYGKHIVYSFWNHLAPSLYWLYRVQKILQTNGDQSHIMLSIYLGSAFLCRWALRYQSILCLGMNNDKHMARSCQPWTNTELLGLSLESLKSTRELVGDVGLASQVNQEWLPQSSKFWNKKVALIRNILHVFRI